MLASSYEAYGFVAIKRDGTAVGWGHDDCDTEVNQAEPAIPGHHRDYRVYVGVILGLYNIGVYIGIVEKKMETTLQGLGYRFTNYSTV